MTFSKMSGALLIFSCLALWPACATVNVLTTIRDVRVDGTSEQAGRIAFRINNQLDFEDVSETTPVYFRLRLDHGATLANTLVDIIPFGGSPIYLPLYLENPREGVEVIAPGRTVQIVRWRAGERDIWLKFTHPSGEWITVDDQPAQPSDENIFGFEIGVDDNLATNSPGNTAVSEGWSNLRGPTRAETGQIVGTPLVLNLSQSRLMPIPAPPSDSLLNFDPMPFSFQTEGVDIEDSPNDILDVAGSPISLAGDTAIARGGGYTDPRWLFHITREEGGFLTDLLFKNNTGNTYSTTMTLYREDGSMIGVHDLTLAAYDLVQISAPDLFALFDEQPSHISFAGHQAVHVSAAYRADLEAALTAHVNATRDTDTFLGIYAVEAAGFNGLAAVNRGSQNATVEIAFFDANGDESDPLELTTDEGVPPNAKRLWVLSDLMPEDAVGIHISSDQPLGSVILRGNDPSLGIATLFQVMPLTHPR